MGGPGGRERGGRGRGGRERGGRGRGGRERGGRGRGGRERGGRHEHREEDGKNNQEAYLLKSYIAQVHKQLCTNEKNHYVIEEACILMNWYNTHLKG